MPVKTGQAVTVEFTTSNPTTGAAADATGTPTGILYVNGTANAATVTVTNQATGVYKAALTLPTLAAGDMVAIRISATVATVPGEGVIWQDTADTSYVSDVFSAVGNIGSGTGSALNFAAVTDNVLAPLKGITFVGTQSSGTYASTTAENTVRHVIVDSGGATDIDIVYQFTLGTSRRASKATWKGLVTNADVIEVYAYDFVAVGWDAVPRKVITGTASTTNQTQDIDLLEKHTGTGTEAGHVYLRFQAVGESAIVLSTDSLLALGQSIGSTTGYSDGAVWVKATGTSGTTPDVNGTADNPCPWADALVVATAKGLTRFRIINGETVTLTAACESKSLIGNNWTLALGAAPGNSISGSYIEGATITGVGTGAIRAVIVDCEIGAATLPPCKILRSGIGESAGTFTLGANGQYNLVDCYSLVAGAGTPVVDAATNITASSGLAMRRFSGGTQGTMNQYVAASVEIVTGGGQTWNVGGGDLELRGIFRQASISGITTASQVQIVGVTGPVTLAGANGVSRVYGCAGAITDSTSPGTTLTNTAVNLANINIEADRAFTDYDPPTWTELEAVSANIYDNMKAFVQLTCRSDAAIGVDRSLWLAAINDDEGSGAGTYSITTDSDQARAAAIAAIDPLDATETQAAAAAAITASGLSSSGIADAVWDEATAGHVATGSFGKLLANIATAIAALPQTAAAIAAAVWGYATRTLTMPPAAVQAVLTGSTLVFRRGDSVHVTIPLDRDVSAAKAVVFTAKRHAATDTDFESVLQITVAAGLTRINAQAPDDPTLASLTISADEATLDIHGSAMAELTPTTALTWDVQAIDAADDVATVAEGKLTIIADNTRATT